jgi:hypothetical protein
MTSILSAHFQIELLRRRFIQNVDDAFRDGGISADERRWLAQLGTLGDDNDVPLNPPRVDRLLLEDGSLAGSEMTGALLLSSRDSAIGTVYLDTLLYGLMRFDTRDALLVAVKRLFSEEASGNGTFEYQLLEGDPFEQRMYLLVDQQMQYLRLLNQVLQRLPSLREALADTLIDNLGAALPDTTIDVKGLAIQIVRDEPQAAESIPLNSVLRLQTLEQALVGDFMDDVPGAGKKRQWLGNTGKLLNEEVAAVCQQALTRTCTQFKSAYAALLHGFWDEPDDKGTTQREVLAQAVAETFHQELLSRCEDGTFGADEFRQLASLLQPMAVRLALEHRAQTHRLAIRLGAQEPKLLAGLFTLTCDNWPGLLLYSTINGLRRFQDSAALAEYCASTIGREELLHYLSASDQLLLRAAASFSLSSAAVKDALFIEISDSIIALQLENLEFVLDQPRKDFGALAAMVDDALDIRHLVDRRLLRLDGGGRWLGQLQAFTRRWPEAVPVPEPRKVQVVRDLLTSRDPALMSWGDQVVALESLTRQRIQNCPDPRRHACAALDEYLAAMGAAAPDAQSIVVQWVDNGGTSDTARSVSTNIDLPDLLLDRVMGLRAANLPAGSRIVRHSSDGSALLTEPLLTPGLIDHLTTRVADGFVIDHLALVQRYMGRSLRLPERRLEPEATGTQILHELLYLDSLLLKRSGFMTEYILNAITQVLTRPVANLREVFGDERVEVCSVSVIIDGRQAPLPMTNVFLLRHPAHGERLKLFWSVISGLDLFRTQQALEEKLDERLSTGDFQDRYLSLFSDADQWVLREHLRTPNRSPMKVSLSSVEGHFIRELQRNEQARHIAGISQALDRSVASRLPAALFNRFVEIAQSDDKLSLAVDLLSSEIQNLSYTVQILDWLKTASVDDLVSYVQMLERYYLSNTPSEDFLSGIAGLKSFSAQALQKQLKLDFPDYALDSDAITVKMTRYVGTPVAIGDTPSGIAAVTQVYQESLTLFALNHFAELQNALLTLEFVPDTPVPAGLTPQYVNTLVSKLDVGHHYRVMLESRLDVRDPEYVLRRERFIAQIPSRMLIVALELKMRNLLSAKAYAYIEGLLDMPDGLARQQVLGQDITLRPLQLLPRAGMPVDPVEGAYLIGPKDRTQGPVILHALFNHSYSFKEFRDEAHLLTELRSSPSLQAIVLGRLDPKRIARYSNGGFLEAHVPWIVGASFDDPIPQRETVTLGEAPVMGNALQFLFVETFSVLKSMSRKQTVTTAQADWDAFVYLMGLGVDQILMFTPGRLGMLINLLQSQSLFKASFEAVYDQQWGKALSEMSAAIGGIISFRSGKEDIKSNRHEPTATETVLTGLPTFSWRNSQLTPALKSRLRLFEVHDVALNTLEKDPLLNVYRDPATRRQYAAVVGQVYRVQFASNHWHIIDDTQKGPRIKLNGQQHWELDLQLGLYGGGGTVSRLRASSLTPSMVEQIFVPEFYGMREIRTSARYKARMIIEAYHQAVNYLETCLTNLNPLHQLDARVSQILSEFFGVTTVDSQLLTEVKSKVTMLFREFSDPSLRPYTSDRFVIGQNRPGQEGTTAFISKSDPQKRIYLTDEYFSIPGRDLNRQLFTISGFNTGTHFRATILLHELSHMALDTHDLAYVRAAAPFPDLLDEADAFKAMIKRELVRLRTQGFSHMSPPADLFVTLEGHQWRDFVDADGAEFSTILDVTNTFALPQARAVFLSDAVKRRELMLKNADSVALLITLLGRQRYTAPVPPLSAVVPSPQPVP